MSLKSFSITIIAICDSPSCVNGDCVKPNECSCHEGWTGESCRDGITTIIIFLILIIIVIDQNLLDWCSSISDHSIDNSYQTNVQTSKVYCGPIDDSTFTMYNKEDATYVASRIKADSDRCTSIACKNILYTFWKLHPYVRDHCCFLDSEYHMTLVQQLFQYNDNFYDFVEGLTASIAVELRKELITICSKNRSDIFCPVAAALDVIDISSNLPSDKSQWTLVTDTYKRAALLSFVIIKKKFPKQYSNFVVNELEIIIESTNKLLKHMQENDISALKTYEKYLPSNGAYKATATSCNSDDMCIFMKIVEQVRIYLDEIDAEDMLFNGKKRLLLNTAVDYREFLKNKQLDRILTVLNDEHSTSLQIANELKEHTSTKFTELRSYFEKIETFNQQIATADIGFISGRLEKYKKRVSRVIGGLKWDIGWLLGQTFYAVYGNVIEKIAILAMEIAEAWNPFKWLTGGGAVKDVLDATSALANALADLSKLIRVSVAFHQLRNKIQEVGEKIEQNDVFLQDVKIMIEQESNTREDFEASRSRFLKNYNGYDPKITKPELDEVRSRWDTLIDAICEVLDNTDGTSSGAIKTIVHAQGLCMNIRAQIADMMSLYEELYDYQFDLVDAMAAYVRASVSLDAANEIKADFNEVTTLDVNEKTTLTILELLGGLSYASYRTHILQTVHLYCNVLEYMNGGEKPSECKGAETDVALLVASTMPVCKSETKRFYSVPSKPTTQQDKAFIDVAALFSGRDVPFTIPSPKWLVDNKWIFPSEKYDSFYVKKFEVYLPSTSDYPQAVYVNAEPVLHNVIAPSSSSTEYIITPSNPLVYEYTMGPSTIPCHADLKITNPYTSCETTNTQSICQLSQDVSHRLYPSIYSQWSLSIKGGQNMTAPQPSTDLSVIVAMQICKISPNERAQTNQAVFQEVSCCSDGYYRPTATSTCQPCPSDSHTALAGYYCEKD